MKKIVLILTFLLVGCSNQRDAVNALQDAGFNNIHTTGFSPFACSEDDFYSTGFIAKNPQGRVVKGAVCSGFLFKNSTIKFS